VRRRRDLGSRKTETEKPLRWNRRLTLQVLDTEARALLDGSQRPNEKAKP
jgi:hypothetical protein